MDARWTHRRVQGIEPTMRLAAEKFAYKNLQHNYVVRELRLIVRGTLPEGA